MKRFLLACLGMVLLGEPATPRRLFFLGLLMVAIIGLRVSAKG